MAAGTIYLNNSAQTAGGGYLMGKVEWSAAANAAANTSQVTARFYVKKASATGTITVATTGSWDCSLTVGGVRCAKAVYASVAADWVLLLEQTATAAHQDDGSGSAAISAVGWGPSGTAYAGLRTQGSGSAALDPIARASAPTPSKDGWKLGETGCGIRMNRRSAQFYHRVRYAFGARSGQTAGLLDENGRAYCDGVTDYVRFVPPKELANQIPEALSGVCTVTVTTYRDAALTQQVGAAQTCTVTLYVSDDMQPCVTALAVRAVSACVPEAWGIWAQGLTRAAWESAAAGSYGSAIVSRTFSMGGASGSGTSGQTGLLPAGTLTPQMTVRDSRGRTASLALAPVSVLPYSVPVLSGCSAVRCGSDGAEDPQGTFVKLRCGASCSDLGGHNTVTLRWRRRAAGAEFGEWETPADGQVTAGFAADVSYTAEFSAVDAAGGEKCVAVSIPAAAAALHLRDGGRAAGFGKYAEEDELLDIAWNARVRKDLTVDGGMAVAGLLRTNLETKARLYSQTDDAGEKTAATIKAYPAAAGIYRVGAQVAGLPSGGTGYGVLVIWDGGSYAFHLYRDNSGTLYTAKNSTVNDAVQKPASWAKHAGTSVGVQT